MEKYEYILWIVAILLYAIAGLTGILYSTRLKIKKLNLESKLMREKYECFKYFVNLPAYNKYDVNFEYMYVLCNYDNLTTTDMEKIILDMVKKDLDLLRIAPNQIREKFPENVLIDVDNGMYNNICL